MPRKAGHLISPTAIEKGKLLQKCKFLFNMFKKGFYFPKLHLCELYILSLLLTSSKYKLLHNRKIDDDTVYREIFGPRFIFAPSPSLSAGKFKTWRIQCVIYHRGLCRKKITPLKSGYLGGKKNFSEVPAFLM